MNNFYKRIKELREDNNLSQTDLAIALNIRQSTVAKWENGTRIPSAESIILLAKFFKVSADYLLGLEEF